MIEDTDKRLVLIADDDVTTRLIVREVLESAGFSVVEAENGEEALDVYYSRSIDLMLLDIEMPLVDGFSVCREIRENETGSQLPICMITGRDDDRSVDRAYRLGATDFISKPIAWPVLGHRVRYLLRANAALNDIRGLVLALPDSIFLLDHAGEESGQFSEVAPDLLGRLDNRSEISFKELFAGVDTDHIRALIRETLDDGEPRVHEHYFEQGEVHLETRFVARGSQSVIALVRDVTKRKQSEKQVYSLAFYDRLTGLPNRALFSSTLDAMIDRKSGQQEPFAILFIDLDRFKRINDTLGHSVGDELLRSVSSRLKSSLRSSRRGPADSRDDQDDVELARLGGDEFVVILRHVNCESQASAVATRIVETLSEPFNCDGHQFVVTPSIGIAIYPEDGLTRDDLLMNADSAMYMAKSAGRNNFKYFSDTMKVRSMRRLNLESDIRSAIEKEEFQLYYQPKVDLESWTVVGAEALLRWRKPGRDWVSPAEFIPVAEETGLILPLGKWVLGHACEQLGRWQGTALGDIRMSVNVSSEQMYSDDIVAVIEDAIAAGGAPEKLLELEITESLFMKDVEATVVTLNRLRELGIGLSVDDFGTGYSSLSYLKRFPIDTLKIDHSFVRDLHLNSDDAGICATIIAMARNLGLKVVAEGVELEEQLTFLRGQGCDMIQGFLFSKPLPAPEFEALVLGNGPEKIQAEAC